MNMVNIIPAKVSAVEPLSYRNAMSHFAGAVNIVTTDGLAGRRGLTLSASCSVSDDPATILICLQRVHEHNKMFMDNGVFALNVLSAKLQPLAEAFAGRGKLSSDERFALGEWQTLATGAPVLTRALASFDCRIISQQDHATHHVLFGEVKAMQIADVGQDEQALVYLNRAYHSLTL